MGKIIKKYDINSVLCITFIASIVSMVTVIALYKYNFRGDFSEENAVWGTFGDYVGGTLNPILSFITLITIIITIHLQHKELINAKNGQIKNDVIVIIQMLWNDADRILNSNIKNDKIGHLCSKLIDLSSVYSDKTLAKELLNLDDTTKKIIYSLLESLLNNILLLEQISENDCVAEYYKHRIHNAFFYTKLIDDNFNKIITFFKV